MSVNLIDSSNIEVKQSGSDISLDLGSEVVVDSIRTKNLYNKDTAYVSGANNQNINNTILLKPNTNYYFKSGKSYTEIKLYDSNETQTRSLGGSDTTTEIGFTTQSNEVKATFIFFSGQSNVDISTFDFTGIQLETGSTATTYEPYQNLNPDTSGLDNGHFNESIGYGGFVKRTIRANKTTYSFVVPNHQNNGFIRNALVMCGDKGFMAIRWNGNNGINPTVAWSSFASSQVSLSHSNGILTIKFASTVYGSVDVLFTN